MGKIYIYIYTGYRISNIYYGSNDKYLVRIGEVNKFLGNLCRDTLCLIIRDIEKRNLGIIFKDPVEKINHQVVSISFVDNTDLVSNRDNIVDKI